MKEIVSAFRANNIVNVRKFPKSVAASEIRRRKKGSMTTLVLFALLVSTNIVVSGQRNADIGMFGGTTYYLGDLNPVYVFSSPRYSIGPILRYNFNNRLSLRGHAIYAKIAGADRGENENITKRLYPVSFSTNIVNVGAQFEFNFFQYESNDNPGGWTPYIFGGLGYSLMISSDVVNSGISPNSHITLPFGVGMKLNLTRRLSSGIEWSHHKTFTSRIDGVVSPLGETIISHNDWYSFFGLFITYKFFKFAADCPVYD